MKEVEISSSIVVVGGGLAGVCAAIEAARMGHDTLLIQAHYFLLGLSTFLLSLLLRAVRCTMDKLVPNLSAMYPHKACDISV